MAKVLALLLASSVALFGQYRAEVTGPPPAELAPGIARVLAQSGFKIAGNGAPYCELWFRATAPRGARSDQHNVTLPSIPIGALVGVIHFDVRSTDRRGQPIKAGWYTLRYGVMPDNEAHQGAEPQRDFLLLSPAADDRDPDSTPDFDHLVSMSRKTTSAPHPAVLSWWKAAHDATGFSQQGDDWILQTRLGDIPIAVILIGTRES
jgi:hypothetical protein